MVQLVYYIKMSKIVGFVITLVLVNCASAANWTIIDNVVREAISQRVFPGGVVAVANLTHVMFQKPYGSLTYGPQLYSLQTANDTKYDIASVTKIMATTYAIMNMMSSNSIKLDDLVSKYFENYDTNRKGNTTIKNLLLHNAGLPYDYPGPLPSNQSQVLDYIRFIKPVYPIGSKFSYSNLGFLLLSKIVEKITNKKFEQYTYQNAIFAGLKDTGFNPNKSDIYKIAPTEYDQQIRKAIVRGQAHERLAYFFNGVAGHSGYFTTATDLIKFMRILLNEGKLPEQIRSISAALVQQFTTVVTGLEYQNTRSYGFDTACPSHKMSNCFGHDGSTGISAWGDKDKKIAFVILTNRGHPDVKNNKYFESFKVKFSDAVMEALGY